MTELYFQVNYPYKAHHSKIHGQFPKHSPAFCCIFTDTKWSAGEDHLKPTVLPFEQFKCQINVL